MHVTYYKVLIFYLKNNEKVVKKKTAKRKMIIVKKLKRRKSKQLVFNLLFVSLTNTLRVSLRKLLLLNQQRKKSFTFVFYILNIQLFGKQQKLTHLKLLIMKTKTGILFGMMEEFHLKSFRS